jgi:chaperonin GroES
MPIQPLFDHVLIKRTEQAQTTASGLILPDAGKEKMNRGVVISVGTGHVNDSGDTQNLEVKEGDTVVFGKYSGSTIQNEQGEDLLILKEKDILGIITK